MLMCIGLAVGEVAQHNTIEVINNEDEVAIVLNSKSGHCVVEQIIGSHNEIRNVRLQGFTNGNPSVRTALDRGSNFGDFGASFISQVTALCNAVPPLLWLMCRNNAQRGGTDWSWPHDSGHMWEVVSPHPSCLK